MAKVGRAAISGRLCAFKTASSGGLISVEIRGGGATHSAPGYSYSDAIKNSVIVWNEQTFEGYAELTYINAHDVSPIWIAKRSCASAATE